MDAEKPPAADANARLRQFKTLVKRFSSYQIFAPKQQREELRLLVQPLYRYSDLENGVRDGALFAFALGTNPEVLLFLEARDEEGGKPAWYYGLARRGSTAEVHGLLDDKDVWTVAPLSNLSMDDPFCHFRRTLGGRPVLAEP